jgi:uncharacterized protein
MATPTLTQHRISGVLGDIAVDVRAAGRDSPRPAIVMVHGFKGFKEWGMWPLIGERLARAGFVALAVNLSGSGVDERGAFTFPERFGHNTFSAELEDLGRVIDTLYRGGFDVAGPSSLGLLGHSRGGGIVILHAAGDPRVRALVTWAAISTVERWEKAERQRWRASRVNEIKNSRTGQVLPLYTDVLDDIERNAEVLDIEAAARRLTIPWLLVHGTGDESVSIAEAEALAAVANPARTRQLFIEGAGHTFGAAHPMPAVHPPELDDVFDATLSFFADSLR